MTQLSQRHFVFVIGTRAQLIKMAPVIVECERRGLASTLLMTGQHQETMQDLLEEFEVNSVRVNATLAKEHATVISLITWLPSAFMGIYKQLRALQVDPKLVNVLVHGDTLSTVLGALAGRRIGASVVHLESGLTSNRVFNPFPEELSRRFVFRLSDIAMCPNHETLEHMHTNYPTCRSINTGGNTILDSVKLTGVRRMPDNSKPAYILASLHRFQNIYRTRRLTELVELLEKIGKSHTVFFVLHPATSKRLNKTGLIKRLSSNRNIKLLPRVGYSEFLRLAAESACVLTDGGSNQEELAALGVPTIIMRPTTERSDGLGKNAVIEHELPDGVLSYTANKKYKTLETASSDTQEKSPSVYIINYLSGNA